MKNSISTEDALRQLIAWFKNRRRLSPAPERPAAAGDTFQIVENRGRAAAGRRRHSRPIGCAAAAGLRHSRGPRRLAVIAVFGFLLSNAWAADFGVTSPGFFYAINGSSPNPTLTLVRGRTYTFAVSAASNHPFFINSPGVQNNNVFNGTITYTVPNVASNYNYFCSIHGFGAQIITVAPPAPPPPTIRILSVTVSSNLVVTSTGTNGWSVIPEFSTNLATTNWFALSVLSNRFLGGTNETFCGRPPANNVFIRIRSQPN